MKRTLATAFLLLALAGCTGDDEGTTELPGQSNPSNAVTTVQPDSPAGTITEDDPAGAPSESGTG